MLIFCISVTTRQSSSAPGIFTKSDVKCDEGLTRKDINIDESEKELDEMIKTLNISTSAKNIEMLPLPPPPKADSSLKLSIATISPAPPLLPEDLTH